MWTDSAFDNQSSQIGLQSASHSSQLPASIRVPRRSLCQRQWFALADNAPKLAVTRYPSSDRGCRHQIFVEHATRQKRVDLPATGRVEVSQEFVVPTEGQLLFEYVVLLQAGDGRNSGRTCLSAVLVNLDLPTQISLLNSSIVSNGDSSNQSVASKFREKVSQPITMAGSYELRIATSVDASSSGASAYLLVDSVRFQYANGSEPIEFASMFSVGSVRRNK